MTAQFKFDNSYAAMAERFYARVAPTPVAAPRLIRLNRPLADELGLDAEALASPAGVDILAGQTVPDGADPLAMAYAGHQFGSFVPQLGDGRAILLGEVIDRNGQRRDIQLKGAGPTPFSRRGDGRAALGPVLREYIVSEAMYALGIPTTRSLAAVLTGEPVARETLLPGAVLTRVASSHIRVGTFQFFAAREDNDALQRLTDHVIARHYPDIGDGDGPERTKALLAAVIKRQADLVAQWLLVGFIHGVMNTDNCSIAGETIDYGPCAFLDAYDPGKVFSSIDQNGRYAYANQARIALWNLTRFAECLLPLLADETEKAVAIAQETLGSFGEHFMAAYQFGLSRKIGIAAPQPGDDVLAQDLLDAMARNEADFTLTFRRLAAAAADPLADGPVRSLFAHPADYDAWAARWRERLASESGSPESRRVAMERVNPAFIPRNHRIEAAIAAAQNDDFNLFEKLVKVLEHPFSDQPEFVELSDPPQPDERVLRTFCGT